jgi:hypothetical protein
VLVTVAQADALCCLLAGIAGTFTGRITLQFGLMVFAVSIRVSFFTPVDQSPAAPYGLESAAGRTAWWRKIHFLFVSFTLPKVG